METAEYSPTRSERRDRTRYAKRVKNHDESKREVKTKAAGKRDRKYRRLEREFKELRYG